MAKKSNHPTHGEKNHCCGRVVQHYHGILQPTKRSNLYLHRLWFPFRVPLLSDIVSCSIPLLITEETELVEPWVQQGGNGVHAKKVCRQWRNENILKCITEGLTREKDFTSHIHTCNVVV